MSYVPGTKKWGDDDIGEPAGRPITWSADYFDALTVDPDSNEGEFDAALQLAFDRWENVASIDFELVTGDADITIGTRALASPVAGLAIIDSTGAEINDVDIFMSTNIEWAPFGSDAPDFFGDFFAVALHEIGHAIGLEHVPDESEIMNATIFADNLGNGDIAAAQYLYGSDDGEPLADAEQVEAPSSGTSGGDGGGGGGGAIAAVLGILAMIFGFLPLGAVGVAAGTLPNRNEDDEDSLADPSEGPTLSELLPTVTNEHYVYLAGFGDHTGLPGCPCSACHQQQMEDEESDFLL